MSTYAELLAKRITTAPRRVVRIPVYLDRDSIDELEQARADLSAERARLAATEGKVKQGSIVRLAATVTELEKRVEETTIIAVLQALSSTDEETVRAEHDPAEESFAYLSARLTKAFQRWETAGGEPIDDLTESDWRRIIEVTPAVELTAWTAQLNRSGQAPDFPTFARS